MPAAIVGRDAELASLRDFVASVSDGASTLVLDGEAGVGKTTLWLDVLTAAEERGLRVLRSRPAESENALSFSGVGDLFDGVLEEALAPLADPQRRALARALVLEDDGGPAPDERAVGIAVLGSLRALAETTPLLVAVDDVQWLDAASSAALAYAARRLEAERVGVLLARRAGWESTLLAELVRSLPRDRVRSVDVRPFDSSALHHVVHGHLGVALPRPILAEVHEASGGNPFYALEIVRTLQRRGISIEAGQPLPVPASLHDLVHGRLQALPDESRDFLLAAAALAHARVELVETATGVSRSAGLEPALDARVVELEGDRIRFTHPLLAAGAYEAASPLRRAEVHARLAELIEDPEARGRHLAASTDEPDAFVASALEDAARHARARGAPRAAALLLDRARELTPAPESDVALRRAVDAAYLHFESGDSPRAEAQLLDVIDQLRAGRHRARALARLARVRSYEAQAEAVDLFLEAIDEAEGDLEILAVAHEGVATCLFRLRERLLESIEHAETAARLALELGDDALAAESLGTQLVVETLLGLETATETATHALALQEVSKERRVLAQPLFPVAVHWWWTDEVERARRALLELLQRSRELGDESSPPYVLVLLGRMECLLGDYESARARAREGQQMSEQSGQGTLYAYNLALEGLAEAKLGNVERARAAALEALERVPATGGRPAELVAREALGHLELARGSPEVALSWLEPSTTFARREHIAEPVAVGFVPDQIEALIELGRPEEAVELLDWYEQNARRLERASALAVCLRCRGLLAAQKGSLDDAVASINEALAEHERVEIPLERGRTLLVLGSVQRRMKRRSEARKTLEDALGTFDRIGAGLWAERARSELRRISGRAATPGSLTPAEERIVSLVAEGRTNREVAAALFLSERTVEGHLSRIYAKLGVRSRTELAHALASAAPQVVDESNTGDSPVSGPRSVP
ncbi:MAG: AAA family ATPase [Actinobacteria bacterium]|nr:AAA family ATPase [Actinomycetota bacterium]